MDISVVDAKIGNQIKINHKSVCSGVRVKGYCGPRPQVECSPAEAT
jgi:hypothetical protein